ncbi:unnamed protein product, partial [Phaeothamnion confervicola]
VAQSVFDRIGIKLVVATPVDAMLVLRYFRRHHLAIFANITPGRSRNSLIDLEQFQEEWWSNRGDTRPLEALEELRKHTFIPAKKNGAAASNPHSSPGFHSIQFTCRQLIRLENRLQNSITKLAKQLKQRLGEDQAQELLKDLRGQSQDQVQRFFFPYEVQILDQENYLQSEGGESSHANYRLRQLRLARRRILGRLLLTP